MRIKEFDIMVIVTFAFWLAGFKLARWFYYEFNDTYKKGLPDEILMGFLFGFLLFVVVIGFRALIKARNKSEYIDLTLKKKPFEDWTDEQIKEFESYLKDRDND